MHIAYFTETYHPQINGVTYALDTLKSTLEEKGHTVSIVYPRSAHDPDPGEIPVPSVSFPAVAGYRIGLPAKQYIHQHVQDVDVVHAHGPFTMGILGRSLAKEWDAPFVATHHTPIQYYFDYLTTIPPLKNGLHAVYTQYEKVFYQLCDQIFSPSPIAANQLQTRIHHSVDYLSNGIDTDFFTPEDATTFKDRYNITGDVVAGYCGRLGYEKKLEDLINFSHRFDGDVVAVGDGFAREYYEAKFAENGVNYLGRLDREEMPRFYSALDVFILPSIAETQGISVLEANACGTPVVGADAMALKHTIDNGVNGYRYPPGDTAALHEKVEAVLNGADLEGSARKSAEQHDAERVAETVLAKYRSVL